MLQQNIHFSGKFARVAALAILALVFLADNGSTAPKDKPAPQLQGMVREFNASLAEVQQAVQAVQHDQIIHGTLMFDKEPILSGAEATDQTPLFEPWIEEGTVYFKIREKVVAPRHFIETGDQGTIGVRYVVSLAAEDRVRVRIDALYFETFHRVAHLSDGTVEKSEMKEIKDRIDSIRQAAIDAAESRRRKESAELVRQSYIRQREDEATKLGTLESDEKRLVAQLKELHRELERRVKAPGADLKAAPFQSAATLKPISAYTDLLILIITPNWLGVETPEGQRGWIYADRLEPLP
jgi:hypothetical protein